jgi:hypothetical protein
MPVTDESYRRIAPEARRKAPDLEPNPDSKVSGHLDPLRKLNSKTEKRLDAEGFKDSCKGVECTAVSTWQDRLETVRDEHLFLYLLRDSVETHLVFYREYAGYGPDSEDSYIEYVDDGNSYDCPENIVRTWRWLRKIDAPTELEHRQQTLEVIEG